jgi:hypothetical protein
MYKSRRQRRYSKLVNAGFLPFEAVGLSRISITSMPEYMRQMIKDRVSDVAGAKQKGWSSTHFKESIIKRYKDNNWVRRTKSGNISYKSVYNMLRDYEEAYRLKYPDYISPWEKRNKTYDKTIEKATKKVQKERDIKFLNQLYKEKELAQKAGNKQQLEIIQRYIDNLKSWYK